jgi:hypothetical protein
VVASKGRMKKIKNPLNKLTIHGIGPIADVEIEIGDMTIIVGPNNAGKTFLSVLLYTLLSVLTPVQEIEIIRMYGHIHSFTSLEPKTINKKLIDKVQRIISDILNESTKKDSITIQKDKVRTLNELYFNGYKQELAKRIAMNLKKNFGIENLKELLKWGEEKASIVMEFKAFKLYISITNSEELKVDLVPSSNQKYSELLLEFSRDEKHIYSQNQSKQPETIKLPSQFRDKRFLSQILREILLNRYNEEASTEIVPSIVPVERIAVITVFYDLLDLYIKSIGARRVLPMNISEKWKDKPIVLQFMEELISASRDKGKTKTNLQMIEGSYAVDTENYFTINYSKEGHPISLPLISSSVAQIIPLDIVASNKTYNFNIIEEPELNLHANRQIDMAQYLYGLESQTFITTHSDILIQQLALLCKSEKKNNSLRILKIYLLSDGIIEPVPIHENGMVERIRTISDAINLQLHRVADLD